MSDAKAEDLASVSVNMRPHWRQNVPDLPQPANVFAVQPGLTTQRGSAPEVYLTFGHITPPNFVNAEDAAARADDQGVIDVEIAPVARLVLNVDRVRQLHDQLGQFLAALENQVDSNE